MSNLYILQGGLMRCCIDSIQKYDGPEKLGTKIPCLHHDKDKPNMRLVDGGVRATRLVWEWYRGADSVHPESESILFPRTKADGGPSDRHNHGDM